MKILVISLSGIGDTLIATPLIHELRLQFPQAQLDALVFWPGSRHLLEGNPFLNRIHQKNLVQEGLRGSLRFLAGLRRKRFDISLNTHTQGRIQYRFVARFIGAPLRLSHKYENHGILDRCLVNRTLPQDYSIHCVENNARLLSLLDRRPRLSRPEMEVYLSEEEKAEARAYVSQPSLRDKKRLGLHVGSGGTKNLSLKRWPLGHYQRLIGALSKAHPNLAFILLGGPQEKQDHEQLRGGLPEAPLWMPATKNLRQAAALLPHCHAFLSVDTALMHLAAAMKTPGQIVIEAPTLNPTNMPWNNACRLVPNPAVHGRNLDFYRYDGRPIQGTREELIACMESVTVEAVREAVDEVLA